MADLQNQLEASLTPEPFIRWAGGKRQLVPMLLPVIREALVARLRRSGTSAPIYVEPFLGAGAVALAVCSAMPDWIDAQLSDYCDPLVNAWQWIKRAPRVVHERLLQRMELGTSKDDYLAARFEFNNSRASFERAILFLYLSQLCFNGLWRVNPKGEFNVPYGDGRRGGSIVSVDALLAVQRTTAIAKIERADAMQAIRRISRQAQCARSVIYADPPYDEGFVDYTENGFDEEMQRELANTLRLASERGAAVIANNANTALVREIYSWADQIEPVDERRAIAADGAKRQAAKCVLITANLG